jgi:hypothetical protein
MWAAPSASAALPTMMLVSVRSGMRSVYASPYQPSMEYGFDRSNVLPGRVAAAASAGRQYYSRDFEGDRTFGIPAATAGAQ